MAATADSYSVDLHYQGVGGNAGFAAFFSGAMARPDEAPAENPIRLANGELAAILPVRCGASCAPANLWWDRGGMRYLIQIALPSTTPQGTQVRVLVETANAMVQLPTRTKSAGLHRRAGA